MAYFPNAYKKVFIPTTLLTGTGDSSTLTAGQIGFFDPKAGWSNVPLADASVLLHPMVVLAQGSYHTIDKIGSNGGYQESIKSKGINPRFVSRFYKVKYRQPVNQIVQVGYDSITDGTSPVFKKGETYLLRIDLKGSPLLRFLGHNAYHTFDAFTGCADPCVDPCTGQVQVDAASVLLAWADQINGQPIFSKFVSASVTVKGTGVVSSATYVPNTATPATVIAGLILTVAYVDTKFGTCSFDPRDHYEMEPIEIITALVDDKSNPCDQTSLVVTEKQATKTAQGTGEGLLREVIMDARYRQEPFQHDVRKREIEDQDSFGLGLISRTGYYDAYYILHSVPRKANPSGTMDSDQYLLKVAFPTGGGASFETWVSAYLATAGTGVVIEDLTGVTP